MPTLANITVKKADGTTDVIYTAVMGSSGDKTPAVWVNQTVGTTPAERPRLSVTTRGNGPGTARRIDYSFDWPIMSQDAGGNRTVTGRMNHTGSILVPQSQVNSVIAEQIHQSANLLASALMKAVGIEGYAPR